MTGVFLPSRVLRAAGVSPPHDAGAAQIAGMIVGAAGAVLALWCLLVFVGVGKGTPMPLDPPERLVVRGPYRFVRNPMYIGAGFALGGAALYFTSMWLLAYGIALSAAAHAFVVLCEERVLSDKFGHDYHEYRQQVGRWIPRL